MRKLGKQRLNNKGAAIAMTIVAVAVISVLALLALWIAYMNYYMKVTDMNATSNFYTAEGVVEQIRVGLQKELSDATGDAYKSVMQKYASMSESARKSTFLSSVETALTNQLQDAAAGDPTKHYDMKKLCSYVYTPTYSDTLTHLTGITNGFSTAIGGDEVRITSPSGSWMEMDATAGTLILRDVNVEYENERGYVSIVNTDFKLQVPTVNFGDVTVTTDLDLLKYVLIADQHLNGTGAGAGVVTVKGSVYGGNGDVDPASTDPNKNNCITLGNDSGTASAAFEFGNSASATSDGYEDRVISGKVIKLNGTSEMTTKENTELWTSDFVLGDKGDDGQKLNLATTSYVADELSIDGRNDLVTSSGKYFGYGNGLSADEGEDGMSAILINGKQTTLNLAGLTDLWLAGRAYIGTRKVELPSGLDVDKNVNIPMSDSIAVRGNQVAYLVPGEALPVNRNPMTRKDYETYVLANADKVGFTECDLGSTLIEGSTDKYLSDYATKYQKVFAPGLNGEYLVYYYMVMDSLQAANDYFEAYYGIPANKDTIDRYLKIYTTDDMGMKQSTDSGWTRLDMNGNWLTLDTDVTTGDQYGTLHRAADVPNNSIPDRSLELDTEALLNTGKFEKLVNNLSTSIMGGYDRVFDNIVIRDEVEDFKSGAYTQRFELSDGHYALVSTMDIDHPGGKCVFIITLGDVNVNGDVKGTVISAGTINVKNGCTIETDDDTKSAIMKLMRVSAGSGTKSRYLYEFLRDGEKFAENEEGGDDLESVTDMNELVNYENWTKR